MTLMQILSSILAAIFWLFFRRRSRQKTNNSMASKSKPILLIDDDDEPGVNSCSICFEEYHEQSRIPRVLQCGHTFCSLCISGFLRTIARCPECKRTIQGTVESLPKNFSILRNVGCGSSKHEIATLRNQFQESFLHIESIINERRSYCLAFLEQLDFYKNTLKNLEKEMENKDYTATTRNWVRKEADNLLAAIKSLLNPNQEAPSLGGQIQNFSNNLEKTLQCVRGGKDIYTYLELGGRRLYGKITEGENSLHFHSLAPYSKAMGEIANMIPLTFIQDFENSPKIIFLDFAWNSEGARIYIDLDETISAKQFYLLCTGERGATYKGASFTTDESKISANVHLEEERRATHDILPRMEEKIGSRQDKAYEGYVFRCPSAGKGGTFILFRSFKSEYLKGKIGTIQKRSMDHVKQISSKGIIDKCGIVVSI